MSTIFHTTIKAAMKASFLPAVSGLVSIFTGVYTLVVSPAGESGIVFGLVFCIAGLCGSTLSILNRRVLPGWSWYFIYSSLILAMGIYILTYTGRDLFYITGFSALFRSALLLGISIDLKRHEHLKWNNMALSAILGIFFASLLILKPQDFP
ncbi:TPA: hypothetical protein ACGZ99_003675, partial [Elizabethkingia anophelis]